MPAFKKIIITILTLQARLIIKKYKPFIVAVTGSVGKTSAKDAIYSVLKDQSKYVRKSEKSLNSDIGLPLTIIGVPNAWRNPLAWLRNVVTGFGLILRRKEYPDCLILEIGADHPGDIKKVAKWLKPDIAVITKVSRTPVHVEFFKSPEQVFEEKSSLADAVKTNGTLVLFADDEKVMSIANRPAVKVKIPRIISYGLSEASDVRASNESVSYANGMNPSGLAFEMIIGKGTTPVALKMSGIIGQTYEYPLLAAAAVGMARNMSANVIAKALTSYEAPKGRMNLLEGINGSTIIDDTYNSSPDAATAALQTLKDIQLASPTSGNPDQKIAVLGDMMELGKFASEEHRKIGREAAAVVSRLITVGPRSRMTADEAVKGGLPLDSVRSFDTSSEAATYLAPNIKSGDIVLVKGSQSMRMERVVKALLKEPEKASRLLVRQEKEWLDKK